MHATRFRFVFLEEEQCFPLIPIDNNAQLFDSLSHKILMKNFKSFWLQCVKLLGLSSVINTFTKCYIND